MILETYILLVTLPLLSLAVFFGLIRILRGPSLSDRVIALDLMTSFGIGVVGVYAILTDQPTLLDVALVFAVLVFLGTVGFAYFIQRRRI